MGKLKEIYSELLQEYGDNCFFCGGKDLPLELCHIMPISQGGTNTPDNFRLVCPQCHQKFDTRPKEIEFIDYLSQLLEANDEFKTITKEILSVRKKNKISCRYICPT